MPELLISTDKTKLNLALVHKFLSEESYWAKNIPLEIVKQSVENSLCFGVYLGESQIGFARVISDFSTFAYLADVFVLSQYRRKGVSKKLMEFIKEHPSLQGLRRWMLATSDAQELYRQFGFRKLSKPASMMEIVVNNAYSGS
ncbi:GNAT family N-acetyltransferase [Desertivirga xinjiangensis]|uniref:GNAT family N-acetyltransferase n=1 Tax=Desertivirga xinjiangensis TaxID=539206 RepID=UPI00210D9059|nr:GNAT family N-acetyltransferase [Pedobacter xinjiangensis]